MELPESPLDYKEIKPVNPKGNQSWIFVGRTDAEAPVLWPPDVNSQLIRKDPDAGSRKELDTTERLNNDKTFFTILLTRKSDQWVRPLSPLQNKIHKIK